MNILEWADQYLDILDEDIARERPAWLHLNDTWQRLKEALNRARPK